MPYMTPSEFYAQTTKLTARYMPEAKNQTRVLRSQGKLAHAAHYDAAFAKILAQLRGMDAMRHGVAEDFSSAAPSGEAVPNSPVANGAASTLSRKVAA